MDDDAQDQQARDSDLRAGAEAIVRALRAAGHEACFVGGCVRDLVMGAQPHDYDIATDARPDRIESLFSHTVPVGRAFGVMLVREGGTLYEVATFRADGAYRDGRRPEAVTFAGAREDAKRRDFTINGLFHDPIEDETIDWVGGVADIEARRVRAIGDPAERFEEDHLRLLRAVRFAARLGFTIEDATRGALESRAARIVHISAERVRDELVRMFTHAGAGRALHLLHETGLLAHVLPEVAAMAGCAQPPQFHPEGDVLVHTALALDRLNEAADPSPALAFAVLLHDVGKPPTASLDGERIRFNGHAEVGAEMADRIGRRLRLSATQVGRVRDLVAHHMRFQHVTQMKTSTLKRFLGMDGFDEHLELHRADCLASHGDVSHYEFCRAKRGEFSQEVIRPEPLVTGRDLIGLGLEPGPRFGRILRAVEDAQLEGEIATREAALELVRWLVDADTDNPAESGTEGGDARD